MIYEIQNEYLRLRVSDTGAEMQSILGHDGTEYLWQGDERTWPDHAPNIFPYVARLTEGRYTYKGSSYRMEPHGFLPGSVLLMSQREEDSLEFLLKCSRETFRQYPFTFEYRIRYSLRKNAIEICCQVINQGKETMYFGIGGHPGFVVPLEKGLRFDDYELEFPEMGRPVRIGMSEACFRTGRDTEYPLENGRTLHLSHSLFNDDAVILRDMSHSVLLKSSKGEKGVRVSYPDMNYLGIWHWPKSEVPYVCIEPWTSLPASEGIITDLERQEDLIALLAGEKYTNIWEIEIIESC